MSSEMSDARTIVPPTEIASKLRKGVDPKAKGSTNGKGSKKTGPNIIIGDGAGAKSKLVIATNRILFSVIDIAVPLKSFKAIENPGTRNISI